jgi:hypothetical protein
LLPVARWNAHHVTTLPVFSRTGQVSRQLTPKELAVYFNLPVALHKEWLQRSSIPSKALIPVSTAIGQSITHMGREMLMTKPIVSLGKLPPALVAAPMTQSGVAVKTKKADDAKAEISLQGPRMGVPFPEAE